MRSFKAVLLGEGRVGKTSIGLKYTQGTFDPRRASTVQAGFYSKKVETSQGMIELNLWDTAGQEEYHAVAPIYYKNAQAALLVYSVVHDTSFDRMVQWHAELRQILGNSVKIFVVANKIDLPGRQVSPARGVEYANSIGCNHFEVSAKTGEGLDMLFRCVTEALVKDSAPGAPSQKRIKPKGQLLVVNAEEKKPNEGGDCC
jgi:small GTP-binding protein